MTRSHLLFWRPAGKALLVAGWLLGRWAAHGSDATVGPEEHVVFTAGTDGYHTYRIPAVVTTRRGTVLAFCEGRRNSGSDTGTIDLLLKRSSDGGRTWGAQQVVWADDHNVCGNPAPVVDRDTGTIWLLLTWNFGADGEKAINAATGHDTRRVFVTCSTDDGVTWAKPREITAAVKRPDWRWYATGPVNGIQLTRGGHKGRLVIPANHTEPGADGKVVSRSQIIYSDDHGATWHLGGLADPRTNESTVAERADGALLLNMRSYRGQHRRALAVSQDGGASWSATRADETLIEPVCQGSLLRATWPEAGERSRLLFCNPASLKREQLTVRVSYDEGATWPVSREIHAGPAAYSGLVMLSSNLVGCLYEGGKQRPYEKIIFARLPLNWLEAGLTQTTAMMPSLAAPAATDFVWKQLPALPDAFGLAGAFAGVSGGALIVAGGANFPHGMPWEGGRKAWHDAIYVLPAPDATWQAQFKLPRPLAYGVSVTTPDGVICAGGADATGHRREVFRLRWADARIERAPLPDLPQPLANACGALVGNTLYVAGGTTTPDATQALHAFWALDLAAAQPAWRALEPWPGPGRMLAVAGALDGAFYLFSGTSLHADAAGKPARDYLADAYCFRPGQGWRQLTALPRPAVAAPSPAIVHNGRLLVVSGDDGRLVNFEPKSQHPGFPRDVLAYDPATDVWTQSAPSPLSRATAPVVTWRQAAVIINGEVRPGQRTPEVWELARP